MESIDIIEIKVTAKSGANLSQCVIDAVKLAANEWRNIRLIHNDIEYEIKANDLLLLAKKCN